MLWQSLTTLAVVLLGPALAQTAKPFPSSCPSISASRYQFSLDSTWKATKVLGGSALKQPRTIIFDPQGNMLVLQATKGVSVHTFDASGCIASTTMLISNNRLNHGLTLTPDGKTLYASSETTAWSWTYDPAARTATNQQTVVKGISTGIHSTRTMLVVPQAPNWVVLQAGSNGNWDYASGNPAAGRSIVKVFDMSKVPSGGWNYNTDGVVLGYGLRNEVALAFDPAGHVWGAENSGDDFRRTVNGQSSDIHIDNPAEELNYLGDPLNPAGTWFGYPTCFTAWSAIQDLKTGDQFVVTPNNTFNDASCVGKSHPPRLSFPAHSAPISNVFDKEGKNMYITMHGSWNRQPAIGYKVVEVPFTQLASGQFDPVAARDSQKGWNDIMWANDPGSCQSQTLTISSCFRLAALAWDPSYSRFFVSSDNNSEGEIWVLAKK
ncbi:soluble quino protein glucose/sorbosone dehydrogenase [Coniochaeta sp. 2T2.1]|nr:soluble quino protein glucose/sorbosone dehydrogenase [Coniochaeta sp. 2T2.1]